MGQDRPKMGPREAQDMPRDAKMGPRWAKMGPNRFQDQRICSQDGQDDAKKGQRQKWPTTKGKPRFLQGPRLMRKAKLTPRGAQDGPRSDQDGPRWAQVGPRSGQDGRKMVQDTEDELQDSAQDRQDAISEGCLEHLMKTNPVEGPEGVR